MISVRGYILAGGRSSRFGSDKARAELAGTPLIRRIADVLRTQATDVTVIARVKNKYADLGLRTIPDRRVDGGPLAGMEAALHDAQEQGGRWIFLASCDLVVLRPTWIAQLCAHRRERCQFVAFRDSFWEPLVACYHTSLMSRVSQHLTRGEGALWKLLEASHGIGLPLPVDWPKRLQANTPDELAAAQEELNSLNAAATPLH